MDETIRLTLSTQFYPNREVQAFIEHGSKIIDQHYHSSEGWLLADWGFSGNPEGGISYHPKNITEKLGTDNWELVYNSLNGKRYTLLGNNPHTT